jgi:hypothetical protein
MRIAFLAIFFVPMLIALKAKPLQTVPYRWATYMAIENAVYAVLFLALGIWGFIFTISITSLLLLLAGALFGVTAFGLFHRKRLGVVFLIAGECFLFPIAAILHLFPLTAILHNGPVHPTDLNNIFVSILLLANIIYFKKRWRLMD